MGLGSIADLIGGAGGGADSGMSPAIQYDVEIAGTKLDDDVLSHLERVTVIDRLRMPDSVTLVFRDPGLDVLDTAGVEIGATVKVSTSNPGGDAAEDLFSGEITSIEAEYDLLGARAVVRGYDKLHRLSAGRKTKTYENVTYSDVAQQIASDAGLDASVDDSGGTVDHVIQGNVSDLDFLYQLARRVGFDLGIDGDKVLFKKPTKSSEAPGKGDGSKDTELVWDQNLLEFRGRMSAVSQVSEVLVRGWDVDDKEAVIGQADAETTSTKISMTPADLADAVGGESLVVVDRPVGDQGAADDLAKAIAEQVASAAYEATAVAIGSPKLKAGQAVTISEIDPHLEGDWVITSARHEFGNGPYRTHLEFSGRQDRSLHGLMAGGLTVPVGRTSIPGVVIGIVTDADDDEQLGRVKVKYPWLGDKAESYWARVAMPGASADAGLVSLPQVNDEVVLAFEQGDLAFPVVIGALWNGQDKPPSNVMSGLVKDGEVQKIALVSRKGHGWVVHDSDDDSGVIVTTKDGKVKITLDHTNGTLDLECQGDVTITATGGDLALKADKAVKIEAGTNFDLKASANMTIKGAKVAIN